MKYSVVKVVNGNFSIEAETSDLNSAKVTFHGLCQSLWNASDVVTARVKIFNDSLDLVGDYDDFIDHRETPEPNE